MFFRTREYVCTYLAISMNNLVFNFHLCFRLNCIETMSIAQIPPQLVKICYLI